MMAMIFAISRSCAGRLRWRGSCAILRPHYRRWAVFVNACRLGAEGIVSMKVDGTYRSGPCNVCIKVHNPASIAAQRKLSDME
jgi:hypothetical protein